MEQRETNQQMTEQKSAGKKGTVQVQGVMEQEVAGKEVAGKEAAEQKAAGNVIAGRIAALREKMAERGIDIYVVPTADFHESEYVGEHFKARQFITGFTGSAGTAVITQREAGLWTDGRYFIQAERQLAGSGVTLYRMKVEGVPEVEDFLKEKLPEKGCIGFDGRVVNAKQGEEYRKIAQERQGSLYVEEDLVGLIWRDRPEMSREPFFLLEETYSGRSAAEKLAAVREEMAKEGADLHILSSLCDIAWLLNIRGGDICHVPVVLSYLAIGPEECAWFVQDGVVAEDQRAYFAENHVTIRPYGEIYDYAAQIPGDAKVLLDFRKINCRILQCLPGSAEKIDRPDPTERMKAVKNPVEIANTIAAHVRDGVAFTKFMYWLKTNIGKEEITEISASDYLEARRREQEHFVDLSFDTICAYEANGAMMHYEATAESNAVLKPEGFLLVDSGGHYLEGTTDITRTMALGPLSEERKHHFTAVCRGNLNLAAAKFLQGTTGRNLDILAREPVWELGIGYRCGTGHGVGYLLNVHEGPNSIRFQPAQDSDIDAEQEAGMITTDEPGIYLEGAYGIRIENELLCRKAEKNEYGQFLYFENITYAPIDLDAIDPEAMSPRERGLLNAYHRKVYEVLSPYLEKEEREWLQEYTREI